MKKQQSVVRRTLSIFTVLTILSVPSIVLAAGGRIHFEGAIVEPACSMQTYSSNINAQPSSSNKVTNQQIALHMNCNAEQVVQMSVDTTTKSLEVLVEHAGKEINAAQNLPLHLRAREEELVPFKASLSDRDDTSEKGILVSFIYS